ncbi:family 43 glycosylhydrolase [Leucobacter viscericola]|uniref:Family 43 glycosylhydrolase n=1 Tax=Leucobacter viscericola TaxID=2714935 RepID=A0A6G7XF55_9MICO|nr:family 43 glycosylhydrolase [Leucobacter viscericola]QIK63142.1 family 43 glycosylhydrolase [Leucobacter viscericola]
MRFLRGSVTAIVTAALIFGFTTAGNALAKSETPDGGMNGNGISAEQSPDPTPEPSDPATNPPGDTNQETTDPETTDPIPPDGEGTETPAPPETPEPDPQDPNGTEPGPGINPGPLEPIQNIETEPVPPASARAAARNWCAGSEAWMRPSCRYTGTFADPTVLPVVENGKTVYYAFGTTTSNLRLPVLRSTDLKNWYPNIYSSQPKWQDTWQSADRNNYNPRTDPAIPAEIRNHRYTNTAAGSFEEKRETWFNVDGLVSKRPSWAVPIGPDARGWMTQENWAPGVAKIGNKYFAYMSVRTRYPGQAGGAPDGSFCIAVATSSKPGGPYGYANGGAPVQCQNSDPGGAIDPEPVSYNGKWYLLWKGQGQAGVTQGLYAQPINTTTGGLTGRFVQLLARDMSPGTWEVNTIENPSMATIGGTSYLFYAGGDYYPGPNNTSNYATGYAICPKGPTAACYRPAGNRLMSSSGSVQGPGGGSLFQPGDGTTRFAYHAYTYGGQQGMRTLRITNVHRWPNGRLTLSTDLNPVFADVPNNHKFNAAIRWLAGKGITTGDKAGNFNPSGNVTRADMAAFLYRYNKTTNYTPTGPEPFADVNKNTKFYKEIRWMKANGLATGSKNPSGGKPLYKPQDSISREAMAAFLYRLSGTKNYKPSASQPLVDITPKSKFYREIRWMYANGITTGNRLPNGTVFFDEKGATSRAAFAAFLQRYDRKFAK